MALSAALQALAEHLLRAVIISKHPCQIINPTSLHLPYHNTKLPLIHHLLNALSRPPSSQAF
jgi:hypothetical protein